MAEIMVNLQELIGTEIKINGKYVRVLSATEDENNIVPKTEKVEVKKDDDLVKIVKAFEGFFPNSYLCPANVWTVGYGTTIYSNGNKVKSGEKITMENALLEMKYELDKCRKQLYEVVKVKLTKNQEDALVSFIYNCGIGNFKKSTLLKKLNAGDYESIPNELMKWVNGGGKALKGLWRRRASEALLFLGNKEFIVSSGKVPSGWENMKYFSETYKNLV